MDCNTKFKFAFPQHQRDMLHSNSKTHTWIFKSALHQDKTLPEPGLHSRSAASQALSTLTFKLCTTFSKGLESFAIPNTHLFQLPLGSESLSYEFTLPCKHNLSKENGLLLAFISQIQLILLVQVRTPDLQFPPSLNWLSDTTLATGSLFKRK